MPQSLCLRSRRGRQLACRLRFGLGLLALHGAPAGAHAQSTVFQQALLVDEGFRVFTEETFEGNGRKCSTCHLPEANYSISPTEIAELNEQDRALVFAENVPGLEEPNLVSELALFNTKGGVSADGQVAKSEFRSSMTLAALDLTVRNSNSLFAGPFGPQLGWAGDGSPRDGKNHGNADANADGSIRAFTNGAIAQHNTKSLARVKGADFRFATDAELDALEAFQRWLGRRTTPSGRKEFALADLTFADDRIEQGKQVYRSPQATCNDCHANGGASFASGNNINLNTGVESELERLREETGVHIPEDEGGVNTPPAPTVPVAHGAFNIQPVIEAPRKRAFFHNSAVVSDVEEAASFYFTKSFLDSPTNVVVATADSPGHCDSVECLDEITPQALEKLGAFIRSLSAFYSLRDCERLVVESMDRFAAGAPVALPLQHCAFALRDVRYVLQGAHLTPKPFAAIGESAAKLARTVEAQARTQASCDVSTLSGLLSSVREMRDAIATTPELTQSIAADRQAQELRTPPGHGT
ncbi:MAG TPA: hypothetical protein VFN67_41760 [Polyangiales bacterium]|nr:hypothetical protein [Polyangiales bacterium]